jgi:hypothetical protein
LVVTPFFTAPLLGPTVIAAAMAVASFLFYPVAAARVRRMFGLTTIHPLDMAMMMAGIAALAAYAASGAAIAGAASVAVLAAIALYCCASAIRRTGA